MPPSPQHNFSQDVPQPHGTAQQENRINDNVFNIKTVARKIKTPQEINERIKALMWLTAPGNGATPKALLELREELDRLHELQQNQKEKIAA